MMARYLAEDSILAAAAPCATSDMGDELESLMHDLRWDQMEAAVERQSHTPSWMARDAYEVLDTDFDAYA